MNSQTDIRLVRYYNNRPNRGKDLAPSAIHYVDWLDHETGRITRITPRKEGWEKYGSGFSEKLTYLPADCDFELIGRASDE